MASKKNVVPEAREALNRFKMEAASEVGVNLKQGYNGDLTSRQAGSIGGQMVKKMVESYENNLKSNGQYIDSISGSSFPITQKKGPRPSIGRGFLIVISSSLLESSSSLKK